MPFKRRATRYPERVTFRKPAADPTVNADGGIVDPGDEYCQRRVKVRAVTGRELEVGDQRVADVTHLVRVQKDSRTKLITPRYWLIREDGTTRLDIVRAYELSSQPRVIEMECKERIQ